MSNWLLKVKVKGTFIFETYEKLEEKTAISGTIASCLRASNDGLAAEELIKGKTIKITSIFIAAGWSKECPICDLCHRFFSLNVY